MTLFISGRSRNLKIGFPTFKKRGMSCVKQVNINVVLNQISLVCKVYDKYRKQALLQKYLDHHGCLERRHDFTKDPSRSQKHCFL